MQLKPLRSQPVLPIGHLQNTISPINANRKTLRFWVLMPLFRIYEKYITI